MIRRFSARSFALASVIALVIGGSFGNGAFATEEKLEDIFTDSDFRNCVVSSFQAQVDSEITGESALSDEELAGLISLTCNNLGLTSTQLAGLEKLTGLTALSLRNNNLSTIDLTANTNLERLILSYNALTGIDVSANTSLTYLDLRGNDGLDFETLDFGDQGLWATETEGLWRVADEEEDEEATAVVETETNTAKTETTQACASWNIDDEAIDVFKGLLAAYGYNTSRYDALAVKMAAAQTNMCDGMNVAEARTLMNAMGVTDLSDAELTQIAEMVTKAYNAINEGKTVEELLAVVATGTPLVPNTGVSTGEFNASVIVVSLGVVMLGAGVFHVVRYGLKRKEVRVTFRR